MFFSVELELIFLKNEDNVCMNLQFACKKTSFLLRLK